MLYVLELSVGIDIIEVFGMLLLRLSYSRTFRRRENRGNLIPVVITLCMYSVQERR